MLTMEMMCQAAALVLICLFQQSLQSPVLDNSCWEGTNDGYIKEDITCKCSDQDSRLQKLTWIHPKFGTRSTTSSSSVNLAVIFRRISYTDTYLCVAEYNGTADSEIFYNVSYAYGPSSVNLQVNPSIDSTKPSINLCGTSDSLTVTCNADSANPQPTYEIFANGTKKAGNDSYTFPSSKLRGGDLTVTCEATNVKFNIKASGSKTITVIEPPSDLPVIKFDNANSSVTRTVKEGINHNISCSVSGGFPPVSSVTVKCGQKSKTADGQEVSNVLSFSRSDHNSNCTCTAEHESGCYSLDSTVKLNVQYSPQLTFTVNGQYYRTPVEVFDGESVNFQCKSVANPQVDKLFIKLAGSTANLNVTEVTNNNGNVQGSFTVFCEDTGDYLCSAENIIGSRVSPSIRIYVQCPTQLENPSDNMSDIVSASETHHTFRWNVTGYPQPREPYVLHAQDVCDSEKTTVVNTELYRVEYIHNGGARGMLVVNLSSLTIRDFTTYYLEINNTIEPVQVFAFRLIHPNKETYECESVNLALIIGVVVAIIVVIVVVAIIIGVILHRRRRRRKEDSPPPSVVGGRTGAIPNAYAGDSLTRPSGTFDSLDSFRPATAHPYQPMEVNGAASSPANGTYANVSVGGESSNPVICNPNGPSHIPDEPSSDRPPSYQAPPVPMKMKPDKSVPQSLRRPIYDTPPVREDTGGAGIYDNINRPPPAHHPASPTSVGNYVNVGSKKKPPVAVKPKKKAGQTGHNDQDTAGAAGNTDEMYENLGFLNDDGVSNNNHGVPQHGGAEGRFRPLPGENQLYNNVQLGHDGGETGHYTNVNLGR